MDFYQACLFVLVAGNTGLLWSQYRKRRQSSDDAVNGEKYTAGQTAAMRSFQLTFFLPYIMAVAADWLQGPHIYAIYKYEKQLPEKLVAALYATGFASGGISASFAGSLADRFGRKKACLLYCVLYVITCLTMLSDNLTTLFVGRFAGGVSTTLLFSVFEAWMISDYHERGLHVSEDPEAASSSLDSTFSTMTTLSCVVAILSGIVGDGLVQASGTRTWPFLASIFCCIVAGLIISSTWRENYGAATGEKPSLSLNGSTSRYAFLRDPKILTLALATCVFEGTMYLFIFFWSAALKTARDASGNGAELPFGLIFSSFMCTMLAGSAIYGRLRSRQSAPQTPSDILLGVVVVVSCCLGAVVNMRDERLMFFAFCIIEGCIGVYFPAMASLKSQLVDDDIRGRVYSVLRAPLNVFVVVAHCLDEEGTHHRNNIFLTCASLLLVVFIVARRHFPQ
ncbi:hypothetical protein K4F52_000828 [Lecanicillium sp. MT-2017a]|nr:hypothetical protein K4F52_000828 [Lecanicillium sp. MT-2017a]